MELRTEYLNYIVLECINIITTESQGIGSGLFNICCVCSDCILLFCRCMKFFGEKKISNLGSSRFNYLVNQRALKHICYISQEFSL